MDKETFLLRQMYRLEWLSKEIPKAKKLSEPERSSRLEMMNALARLSKLNIQRLKK